MGELLMNSCPDLGVELQCPRTWLRVPHPAWFYRQCLPLEGLRDGECKAHEIARPCAGREYCCRSSTGSFRGYDPGGATAFEIYVTETKNWSGFRIFWGYKQVAWAIHPSSDSRWTYLPQAHNPGIICIERSKKLRKVRLSDGCSS